MRRLPILSSPAAGGTLSLGAVLLHGTIFVLGLVGFCRLLRGGLEQHPEVLVESHWRSQLLLEHFLDQKDELDVVFVGSSRFLRGINPAAFDEMTALAGQATRSFSYSMNGMRMPEIISQVDWIIDQEPAKLRHLMLEVTTLDPLYREDNRLGRRMIEWHTPRTSLDCLSVVLGSEREPRVKLDDALPHLAEGALHLTNLGLGPGLVARLLEPEREARLDADFNGYATEAEVESRLAKVKATTPTEKKTKRANKRALVQQAGDLRDELPPSQERMLREFIARVEAAGIEVAFVTMPAPCYEDTPGFYFDRTGDYARSKGILPAYFTYADRERYSSLYRPINFIDAGHLSPPGAVALSRRLALDFIGQYGARRGGS